MKKDQRTLFGILSRCLRLRCPACGQASIVQRLFKIKVQCPSCGVLFNREQGFFVGPILINVVTTEAVILAAYFISLPFINNNYQRVLTLLFIIGIVFPISFYHYTWSIWLTFDHLVEGLPKAPPPAPRIIP
jgi:uncharacterized protein (DUF983 family)